MFAFDFKIPEKRNKNAKIAVFFIFLQANNNKKIVQNKQNAKKCTGNRSLYFLFDNEFGPSNSTQKIEHSFSMSRKTRKLVKT